MAPQGPKANAGKHPPAVAIPIVALLGALLFSPPGHPQSQEELQGYQQRLQQLFQRLDRDSDGRLEATELEGQTYLQKHFSRLDQQRRGYLTPTDLRIPTAAGNGERVRRFFSKADINGDGELSRPETAPYPWIERRFNDADRNGNGSLSREELRQMRRGNPQPR